MAARKIRIRKPFGVRVLAVAMIVGCGVAVPTAAWAATTTTAWQNGSFNVDTPNVVRRSDIVLGRANTDPTQFVPLGNGTLGAAVWAANGFTAQLNRSDTFPDRKSPGQLVIPGLSKLTGASNFTGYLDPYDGMLHESGGGMTLTAYVRADTAQLVVDVTGADPASTQTAQVKLWSGRSPAAQASGATATLAETWVDNTATGASGQTFGSLAGISAGGRNVAASNPDGLSAQVSFNPNTDGSYRVIVAAPAWTGGNAITTANSVIGSDTTAASSTLTAAHLSWWHNYWSTAGLIKITSSDGSGEYVENLRTLYLYDAAAERGGPLPGSQAGVADLFNFSQDNQAWYPAGYWFWNLRMQVQANLSAGLLSLNSPVFNLYQSNINNISAWTSAHMPGRQGLCVPETMRFNGNGYYQGGAAASNASCDSTIAASYNSLTLTSGAEIGLWIWQTYLTTDDKSFLQTNYPLMSGAARFLLSAASTGSDGYLHTQANAHETQWNVTDPTTDVVAMQALFPVVVKAAQTLGVDPDLVTQLNAAIPKIPPFPRTDTATKTQVLPPSADAQGADMIALSTQPTAQTHNAENLGLEAVWPYNLIGDSGTNTALAGRTYTSRSYVNAGDWTFDSLQAARLGLASEVKADLITATNSYQAYPSGLASLNGPKGSEAYIEQAGVAAATVSEALVQDYDGLLRIAPAWPSAWTGEGTVYIQHNTKVHVQVANGTPSTVAIVSGSNNSINMRSPWPGQAVTVVDGSTGATVVASQSNATFTIPAQAGKSYLVELTSSPATSLPYAAISGSPATTAKHLGNVSIGLDPSTEAPYGGTAAAVPGTVQAENYNTGGQGVAYSVNSVNGTANSYRSDGVDLETTADTGGGYDLGWTSGGQWFRYTVNVASAGTYTVNLRVAAPSAVTGALHLSDTSGKNLSGAVNIPATGGWQTWTTVTATVTLPAGQQVLTLNQDTGGWNINNLTFAASSALRASPTSLSFGNVAVGSTSSAQTVAVSNPGTSAAPISSVSTSAPFVQTNNCGSSLAAGASCTVNVQFKPTAGGAASGTLSVASSAPGSPLTVALSGTGTATNTNLALNQPVTASGSTQTFVPANAVDGNTSTYWESANNAFPQWFQVDLGSSASISKIVMNLPPSSSWGARTQTITIQGSTDGTNYTTLAPSQGYTFDPATGNTATVTFTTATVRYVKLTFTANTAWPAGQLSELGIYTS